MAPAAVLSLQRSAGNRAVSALMRSRQDEVAAEPARATDEPISVALYLPPAQAHGAMEFSRQAESWARNHGATGVEHEGLARIGIAMPVIAGRPQETLQRVFAAVRRSRGLQADAHVPLAALAVFTHGLRDSVQLGARGNRFLDREELAPLLDIVAEAIVAHGDVIFYACSAAGPANAVGAEAYRNLVTQVYNRLAGSGDVEVWGHSTAGHATGNRDTASTSGEGRQVLVRELAQRTIAARGHGAQLEPAAEAAIATVAEMWRRALAPGGHTAAMFALIEEVPLLGYDAFYRLLAGIDSAEAALAGFPHYGDDDRARFSEGVALVRARFDVAAADAAIARALTGADAPVAGDDVAGSVSPRPPAESTQATTLPAPEVARALAFYRRRAYPGSLLQALRSSVGDPDGPEPADAALVQAVARYQASQMPPLTADGMAGPRTLERLDLEVPASEPSAPDGPPVPDAPDGADASPVADASVTASGRQPSTPGNAYRGTGRPRVGQTLAGHPFVAIRNRIGIVIDGRPFLYADYGGHHGFQYGGADTGDAFDTAIERVAEAYERGSERGDRYRAHAARSMRLPVGHEGEASAINTYDATILTVGAGFARERLDRWLRSLAGTPAGNALAEVPYLSGLRFDRSNAIRLDIEALNRIAAAIEAHAVAVAEAQVREYVRASALNPRHAGPEHLDRLDTFAEGSLQSQPHADAVLGVATYLHHGQPGYTPDPGIDAQEAMHRYPDSPWAQTAEICRRQVERIWRARRDAADLAAPNGHRPHPEQASARRGGDRRADQRDGDGGDRAVHDRRPVQGRRPRAP